MRFIGFYDYTVILTYMSLVSGCVGVFMSAKGRLGVAILCLLVAGICDMFDGTVARSKKNRTDDEKSFGIQLDSICDLVSFGVFPAVYLYFSGMDTPLGIAILVLYILCAIIRLAYYNVLEIKRQQVEEGGCKGFRGLPVTTAAIIFPLLFALGRVVPHNVMIPLYYLITLLTAILFITDIHVPKLDVSRVFVKLRHTDK